MFLSIMGILGIPWHVIAITTCKILIEFFMNLMFDECFLLEFVRILC